MTGTHSTKHSCIFRMTELCPNFSQNNMYIATHKSNKIDYFKLSLLFVKNSYNENIRHGLFPEVKAITIGQQTSEVILANKLK